MSNTLQAGVCECMHVWTCARACMCVCMCVCLCMCGRTCICVYVYLCVFVYVCTYTCIGMSEIRLSHPVILIKNIMAVLKGSKT